MIRKTWIASVLAAVLMLTPMMVRGASDSTGAIGVTVTVDQFAEWADAVNNYTISAANFDDHITAANQTRTATRNLTLYTNVTVTLAAVAGSNSGVLTDAGSHTLVTSYDLTAAQVTPTPGILGATAFFDAGNTYTLTHAGGNGSYTVTLTVTAASTTAAPDAGNYTCGLSLTATW